ncbi:hypothetical protein Tco_0505337 [Tanacetum coccineum]
MLRACVSTSERERFGFNPVAVWSSSQITTTITLASSCTNLKHFTVESVVHSTVCWAEVGQVPNLLGTGDRSRETIGRINQNQAKVLEKVGSRAYKLELSQELSRLKGLKLKPNPLIPVRWKPPEHCPESHGNAKSIQKENNPTPLHKDLHRRSSALRLNP